MLTTVRTYLAIHSDWFTRYAEDKPDMMNDCYIAEISTDYWQLCMIDEPLDNHRSGVKMFVMF